MRPVFITLFAGLLAFGSIAYGQKNAAQQDAFQHPLEELPVTFSNAEVPSGRFEISINNHNEAGDLRLGCQFFVRDWSIHRISRKCEHERRRSRNATDAIVLMANRCVEQGTEHNEPRL